MIGTRIHLGFEGSKDSSEAVAFRACSPGTLRSSEAGFAGDGLQNTLEMLREPSTLNRELKKLFTAAPKASCHLPEPGYCWCWERMAFAEFAHGFRMPQKPVGVDLEGLVCLQAVWFYLGFRWFRLASSPLLPISTIGSETRPVHIIREAHPRSAGQISAPLKVRARSGSEHLLFMACEGLKPSPHDSRRRLAKFQPSFLKFRVPLKLSTCCRTIRTCA